MSIIMRFLLLLLVVVVVVLVGEMCKDISFNRVDSGFRRAWIKISTPFPGGRKVSKET